MNYNVEYHANFKKELKPLAKKYPSIKEDLQYLLDNIEKELALADDLGNGFRKIRFNIKSKGKGKSGGARVISYEILLSAEEKMLSSLPFTINQILTALILTNFAML